MATPHRPYIPPERSSNPPDLADRKESSTAAILTDILLKALVGRSIETGKRLITQYAEFLRSLSPNDPGAPRLHYVLAGWTEYSELAVETCRRLREAYRQARPDLPLKAWGWIEAGNVSLALYENDAEKLVAACGWLKDNSSRFDPSGELLAIIDLAQARLTKRQAGYPAALGLVRSAIQRYLKADLPGMEAISRVTEGWLLMQSGDLQAARETWDKARSFLTETEDWTALANMRFAEARHFCRCRMYEEALRAFQDSDEMHSRYAPNHRTRRRVLIEWANLELRMAVKISDSDRARADKLRKHAADRIAQAEKLLKDDRDDHRNRVRLYLAQANDATKGARPLLVKARQAARRAYELAKQHANTLMMARARLKQAKIESSAVKDDSSPIRIFVRAAQFSTEALELSRKIQSDRLTARIHTFRGNLFFDFPFADRKQASSECEAAKERMRRHQDVDYVVEEIKALEEQLESDPWEPKKA